jgi:RNA polymerase sigma-70 factor (ECF subfamily)
MRTKDQKELREPAGGAGPSDEELMVRYKNGDVDAMNEIVTRHSRPLFGFLVRQTGSRDAAEDAYQEVFLKVARSAKTYQPSARFSAWLYTIARHVVIDRVRRERYRAAESLSDPVSDDSDLTRQDTMADPGPNPEDNLRGAELAAALESAVGALPPEQREVFLLRERANLSFAEIAKVTRAPLNTVKTRMRYALNHLKQTLAQGGFLEESS